MGKNDDLLKNIGIASGDLRNSLKYATVGAKAGYTGMKTDFGSIYDIDKLKEQSKQRGKEFADAHISEWLQAGEELVYLEKLETWKKTVENSPESAFYGLDISKAIEVMRMLDSDAEVKDVVEKFKDKEHCGGYVEKLVLSFSKRGPEYMEQFMSTLGMELTPQMKERLETLKKENRQYAQNELSRNRTTKEEKTSELEKASLQLKELSTENIEKDTNQAVQE